MSRRTSLALALACLCAPAIGASLAVAATPEALRACILENLPRYDDPDRALVAQYADIETSCRAALDGSESVDVEVVPEGGQQGGGDDDPGGAGGQGSGDPPTGTERSTPGSRDGAPGGRPAPDGGSATGAPSDDRRTAANLVAGAIRTGDDDPVRTSPDVLGAPPWLLALVVGMVAIVLGGAVLELRRGRR